MNKKLVVKILRKKTHRFLTISVVIMVISLGMINFMFSYLTNQYEMINKDYITNQNVKIIHVDSKVEADSSTSVHVNDEKKINNLLLENGLLEKAKAYPIFSLPTVFDSSMETAYSVMGLSEELAFLISDNCTLQDKSICVSLSQDNQISIEVPLIVEKDGGYSSSETVRLDYSSEQGAKSENAIFINSIPNNNQAYVNESEAQKLLEVMYQNSTDSFEFIQESQLYKIIVYVKDIKDVDTVGELLKEHDYFTSYTFNSFENFSINISSMQVVLIVLGIIFVMTSILTAVLLIINFLRIQRKEVAILKLNGYSNKSISSIYTKLISTMLQRIFIISFAIYLASFILQLFPVSLEYFLVVVGINILILLLTLVLVYFFGIKKICNKNMIDLLKTGKEFD